MYAEWEGMGSLEVYLESEENTSEPLFSVSGDQGNTWHVEVVDIPKRKSAKVMYRYI